MTKISVKYRRNGTVPSQRLEYVWQRFNVTVINVSALPSLYFKGSRAFVQ
ncbi:UNVERIFIED_CONTAM: hypothetical protein FKN15_067846 [Acipenser sinensis]